MRYIIAGAVLLLASPCGAAGEQPPAATGLSRGVGKAILNGVEESQAGSLLQELVDNFNDLSSTMVTIKNEATAQAANPKIKAIFDKLKDVKSRDRKVSDSTKDALVKKYRKPLEDAGFKVGLELARIRQLDFAATEAKQVEEILQWMSQQK